MIQFFFYVCVTFYKYRNVCYVLLFVFSVRYSYTFFCNRFHCIFIDIYLFLKATIIADLVDDRLILIGILQGYKVINKEIKSKIG